MSISLALHRTAELALLAFDPTTILVEHPERFALGQFDGTQVSQLAAVAGVGHIVFHDFGGEVLNRRTVLVKVTVPTNIQFTIHSSLLI